MANNDSFDYQIQQALRMSLQDVNDPSSNHNNNDNDNTGQFSRRYIPQTWNNEEEYNDKYKRIEESRNIILPELAMQELSAYECQFPYILKLSNEEFTTHCGVEEFSAKHQTAMIPQSMYKQLNLSPHSQLLCEYVNLKPATKLVFEPSNISIKDQKGYMGEIRKKIGKLTCLSLLDTFTLKINDKSYALTLVQAAPNIYDAVSLLNVQWSVDIEIREPIDDIPVDIQPQQEINQKKDDNDKQSNPKQKEKQDKNECPIVSSISSTKGGPSSNDNNNHKTKGALQKKMKSPSPKSTAGGPLKKDEDINLDESDDESASIIDDNNNTIGGTAGGGNEDGDELEEEDENAGFETQSDGWGSAPDEEHSDWDYDGQDYIPIKPKEYTPPPNQPKLNIEDEEELIPDKDTTMGNHSHLRPSRIKQVQHRAWICEHCYAINNLIDSMARNYKCACCAGRYRPGQKLIESAEQDKPVEMKQKYTVWPCVCSWVNDISWNNCSACGTKKPDEGLATWITDEKPNVSGDDRSGAQLRVNDENGNILGDGSMAKNLLLANKRNKMDGVNGNNGDYQYQWQCPKCFEQNSVRWDACLACGKYRNRNEHKKKDVYNYVNDNAINGLNEKRRIVRYGNLRKLGNGQGVTSYPIFGNNNIKMNQRLIKIFGKSYRNGMIARLPSYSGKNAWGHSSKIKVSHGLMRIDRDNGYMKVGRNIKINPVGPRAISINEKTGYLAVMTMDYIFILKPSGSCGFIVDTMYKLPTAHMITSSWMAMELCRVRFVGNSIYVFHYDKHTIQYYDYDENKHTITYVAEIFDKYFVEAKITDIVVTKTLLIVLFDRWLGVYKLYPSLEWYHAVAFSKTDNVSVRSIEMSCYDDWEDRTPMNKECYFMHSQKAVHKLLEEREDEEKQGMEDEMKVALDAGDKDGIIPKEEIYKKSIKNWIFINAENHLIAIHPTNPTFDFLTIADNVQHSSSYCNSRKYGTFYINNDKDRIVQSSKYSMSKNNVVCEVGHIIQSELEFNWDKEIFRMIPLNPSDTSNGKTLCHKDIKCFDQVVYDENYGISGRLLANCVLKENKDFYTKDGDTMFYQLFNQQELMLLKKELMTNDYFLMPGTDTKPFNLIVYVFEMLYGTDLIDHLLQAPDFNPVYALPGKVEDEEVVLLPGQDEEAKQEQKEEVDMKELNPNKLLVVGSTCLVNVDDKWCNGKVIKEIKENDKEDILEIEYIIYSMLEANIEHNEIGKVRMERFSDKLKYNEAIPISADIKYKEIWKVGDKCLFFAENLNTWFPGEVKAIFKDEAGKWMRMDYQEDELPVSLKLSMDDEDSLALNLRKLEDVVHKSESDKEEEDKKEEEAEVDMELEFEEIDGPNVKDMAMMNIMGEGPLNQSYIAIKPVGDNENEEDIPEGPGDGNEAGAEADIDEEDDMEIEEEAEGGNDNNQ